ncbi:MAG: universal stress protein [Anaerolineae bacterium]
MESKQEIRNLVCEESAGSGPTPTMEWWEGLSQFCDAAITKFVILACYVRIEMEREHARALVDPSEARSLILDRLDVDPAVARRLSPAVASRHHALPVAAKDRRVTVAMADPTDRAALEAVARELGVEPYVVQGDRICIDRLLARLWCEAGQDTPRLLAYAPSDPRGDQIASYAEYIGAILNASLERVPEAPSLDLLVEKARHGYALIIMGRPDESLSEHLFSGPDGRRAAGPLPASLLITQGPRVPLRKLLLVMQDDPSDSAATEWTLRLAGPSGASVTVLAVVPPLSGGFSRPAHIGRGLTELLATDTTLGRHMRQVAQRLVGGQVEGTLRLRQGSPGWEIRREALEGRFDLVVVAAAAQQAAMWPLALADRTVSLIRTVKRPILVAA